MLYLYQSNRLESLAEMLYAVQRLHAPAHPLAAEHIVVQSQGMRRFINRFLAEQSGIAANIRYSLPAGFTWQLMRKVLPDIPALSPFAPEVMRWRLLDLFADAARLNERAPLAAAQLSAYLAAGRYAAYDLAGQMADIFDQYLVYRPDWIDAWQAGKTVGLGEDEAWQAELWRYLDDGSANAPHRVAMWRQLNEKLDASVLPERLSVFGIATLAPMYLDLLKTVSRHCDVHIFALNPSSGYWGNVLEPAQILRLDGEADLSHSGHPLLASLGKQGRDFFDALAENGAEHEISAYENDDDMPSENGKANSCLLHRLQHDIQTLSLPQPHSRLDGSIVLKSAHSPLRELHILKEEILRTLDRNRSWQPHDVAVLTPNIEPYLPFIEAVFGQAAEGSPRLPYSVSDIKISRRQALLHALEMALEAIDSRFETDKILPLLENETVLRRFGLSRDDLPLIHDTVARLNIRWGADGEMRGSGDTLFTWQQGLERLILGWLLPDSGQTLWQEHSPFFADPNQTDVLARFAAFVRTLADTQKLWRQDADITEWTARVRTLLAALTEAGEDDAAAVQHLEQALARWQEEAALAGFARPLPSENAVRHILRFLGSQSDAGFLRHGITFCSMVPMRSLPFKMLCLIGLNDGDFPRNTKAAAFDLIARHPKRGDRSRRDDDRYLFLEALMSAREKLYLSYVGRDVRSNEALPPSALVSELNDVLADMTGQSPAELRAAWTEQHPLQDFSRRYFNGSGLRAARSDYAAALNLPETPAEPFYSPMPSENPSGAETDAEPPTFIDTAELIGFWKNPVKFWLKNALGWQPPFHDHALDTEEPFQPDGNELAFRYMLARRDREDFADTALRLNARSQLPPGELGLIWQERSSIAAKSLDGALVSSEKLPPQPYALPLDGITLNGSLEQLYRNGQIRFAAQMPNAPQRTEFYLEHLIFCAAAAALPSEKRPESLESHWLAAGETLTLPALSAPQARELLQSWLAYYRLGQTLPLPFFAKTSLAAADGWLDPKKKTPEEAARDRAKAAYFGSSHNQRGKPQQDYPEIKLVFGTAETPPLDTPLFWHIVQDVLLPTLLTFNMENNKTF